jgi:hypothetical protein
MFVENVQPMIVEKQSAVRPVRTRTLVYDFGRFVIEEHDMRTVWPAGDPVPRDNETLVLFVSREGNLNYEG